MAAKRSVASYGSWKSSISSDMVASGTHKLSEPLFDGDYLYWLEGRPQEAGRSALVRVKSNCKSETIEEVVPRTMNVRTRANEYGGGSYTVNSGEVFFVNFEDQNIFRRSAAGQIDQISPSSSDGKVHFHYGDLFVDRINQMLFCVREDLRKSHLSPTNTIVAFDLKKSSKSNEPTIVVQGGDFFSNPQVSPDGKTLAWLRWNHPNMPWDESQLFVGDVDLSNSAKILNPRMVAGEKNESIFQPLWSQSGVLYFISDQSGFWNLYAVSNLKGSSKAEFDVRNILPHKNDFGVPQWVFGLSTYAFLNANLAVATYTEQGRARLGLIEIDEKKMQGQLNALPLTYSDIWYVRALSDRIAFIAGSPRQSVSIVELQMETFEPKVRRAANDKMPAANFLAMAEPIEFQTAQGKTAHAFFYPPCNPYYVGLPGELPPLIVEIHGGPTSQTTSSMRMGVQYWTSRGFAVVDVNYGGSSGFGRAYRDRLKGQWGVVDVEDCLNAAKYLRDRGLVDGQRMVIRGGSAGGFTALLALREPDVFKAGAIMFGVTDLSSLATETHNFESRYLDQLIGPYPEDKTIYEERSPMNHADHIKVPVIFFQGTEDRVVVPAQTERMVQALRKNGVPVAYISYEGEQHGFRKAENIKNTLQAELSFYAHVFEFPLDGTEDEIVPIAMSTREMAATSDPEVKAGKI